MVDQVRSPHIEWGTHRPPVLEQPELIDALRHGNIYEVLRTPGVNRRDIEDYLATQSRLFQNQILQDYQVYAPESMIPAPEMDRFPVHSKEMAFTSDDRQFFRQDTQAIQAFYQPEVSTTDSARPKVRFKEMNVKAIDTEPGAPGEDVRDIAEKAVQDTHEFFNELSSKVVDAQMIRELKAKTADLDRETQRIISLVLSGQIDPEYVLIAAAKSTMLVNGTLFSWKGKKIMNLNEEMNKASKDLIKMNPNDEGYMKELQMMQNKTRSGGSQMQLEMMDIQKFSQNIATALDWVNNAIRMMAQMRQTPTQAITAR